MAALGSQSIASSYEQLLHVDRDQGGNSTTHVSVKDGDNGTTFALTLATDAVMITSDNRLEFGDTGTYIHQSANGVLDLVSDTEIEINATTIDMNGAIDLSGDLTLAGDIVFNAAGKGVCLGVTSNTDSNTLDDYEEGTWTVAATMGSSGTVTMESGYDLGSYTKIGRMVHVQGYVSIAGVSSPVGTLNFSLPIATGSLSEAADVGASGIFTYSVDFTSGTSPAAKYDAGASTFAILISADNAVNGNPTPADDDWYAFSFSYVAA